MVKPSKPRYNPLDILLPYQRDWLKTGLTSYFMVGLMARQVGKSTMAMAEAVNDCITTPKTTWTCLSTTERQSGELLAKGKQWAEAFRICAPASLHGWLDYDPTATEIRWGNGSRIISVPATENSRGWSGNVLLDEYALHRDGGFAIWQAAYAIATNRMAGRKKIRIISTPSSRETKFYDIWHKEGGLFTKKLITLPDAIAQGLPADEDEIRAGLDDDDMYAIEFLCQFADSSMVAFGSDLLMVQSKNIPIGLTSGQRFVGYDVARSGDKSVIVTLIKRGGELYTEDITTMVNTPFNEQLRVLKDKLKGVSKCRIDSTGMGAMLAEEARRLYGAKVEGYLFTQPSKTDLMVRLHKALDTGVLWLADRKDVRDDLGSMDKVVSNNGKVSYHARHSKDGHADICCAYALAVEAANQPTGGVMPVPFHMPTMM